MDHDLRPEVAEAVALNDAERLREEDPFTGQAVLDVPANAIVHRSRFEFDLNRPADGAVYCTPDQCWGLELWKPGEPNDALVQRSLDLHANYYRELGQMLDGVAEHHPRFVLLDIHSYNHRRDGPEGDPQPQEKAPDINIGTFSMPDCSSFWRGGKTPNRRNHAKAHNGSGDTGRCNLGGGRGE